MFDEEKRLKKCETIGKELSEGTLENVSGGSYEQYAGDDERWTGVLEQCPYCQKWMYAEIYAPHLIYFHQIYGDQI